MLAIARALVRDPKIVLLDEPFEGLAPLIVRDLLKACRELAAAGQTIVLVEQNLAATLALAQRVYIINNGHIVHEGPAAEIKAQPEICSATSAFEGARPSGGLAVFGSADSSQLRHHAPPVILQDLADLPSGSAPAAARRPLSPASRACAGGRRPARWRVR